MFRLPMLTSFIFLLSVVYAMPNERRSLSINDPSLPPAVKSMCSGGVSATTVLELTTLGNGNVTVTKGTCTPPDPAANLTARAVPVVARQTCVTAPNDCVSRFGSMFQGNGWVNKCGAPCDSACYSGSGGPNPYDCQYIFNSMLDQDPQLFTLEPNNFLLLTYNSCGTGIQNQIASSPIGCSQKMIYDYTDWAGIGNYLAFNCQAAESARGGKCTGTTGLYQPSVPDYYVQVYAN